MNAVKMAALGWVALWVISWALSWAEAAPAEEPPRLQLPVDCRPDQDCFIHNYMDALPGPGARDHACGPLANDGHQGTDFRVRDLAEVARGVTVLAAAPGQVLRVRDGLPDRFPDENAAPVPEGQECGNGAVLDHGGGWTTQYCHLRQGSLRVAPGDQVAAGEAIGLIGLSGLTEFPHLHLTVWQGDRAVDPFLGPDPTEGCQGAHRPLWSEQAARRLAYQPSGVINAGFAAVEPSLRGVERGDYREQPPQAGASLWFYVRLFGLYPGDRQRLRVFGPQGRLVMEWTSDPAAAETHKTHKTLWLQPIGRPAPEGGWPSGRYRGEFLLFRQGVVVLDHLVETEIR